MAFLFGDSFDHYATADIIGKYNAEKVSSGSRAIGAYGRNGTNGLRFTGGTNGSVYAYIRKTLSAVSGAGFVTGFSYQTSAVPESTGSALLAITQGGPAQLFLRLNSDMTLSVLRGFVTVLGTSTSALSTGVPYFIEFKGTIDPSAGTVYIRVNGSSTGWLSLTGLNTRDTSTSAWNGLLLGNNVWEFVGHNASCDFDDLYVLDQSGSSPWNDFLGDVRACYLSPSSDGANTGWTPSTGSNHAALVDETAPNGDTDYNSTATLNAKDTFTISNLPISGVTVYAVQHNIYARKTDAGTAELAAVTRVSGVDYDSSSAAVGVSYAYAQFVQQVNPGTSAQYTESEINALETGYKKTA